MPPRPSGESPTTTISASPRAPSTTSSGYNSLYLGLLNSLYTTLLDQNSPAAPHYLSAIDALKKCPVPFTSVESLSALDGFSAGVKRRLSLLIEQGGGVHELVKKQKERSRKRNLLDNIQQEFGPPADRNEPDDVCHRRAWTQAQQQQQQQQQQQGDNINSSSNNNSKRKNSNSNSNSNSKNDKSGSRRRDYIPLERSGGWGLLVGLHLLHLDSPSSEGFPKEILIKRAQKYSKSSYTYSLSRSSSGSGAKYITAWSTMKRLITNGLVYQVGRPVLYALTQQGVKVARRCGAVVEGLEEEQENSILQQLDLDCDVEEQEQHQQREEEEDTVDEDRSNAVKQALVLPRKNPRARLFLPAKTSNRNVSVDEDVADVSTRSASSIHRDKESTGTKSIYLPTKRPSAAITSREPIRRRQDPTYNTISQGPEAIQSSDVTSKPAKTTIYLPKKRQRQQSDHHREGAGDDSVVICREVRSKEVIVLD
ncbi:unnamed protein product [Sympodiomycopsis kandeliae]